MAPIIAALLQQGFSILGGALLSKGKDVVEEKLGIDIDKALGTEEGRIKLKQLEMEHEQWLVEADIRRNEQELQGFKIEVEDRGSARARDAEFIKAGTHNSRADMMFILAVIVICGLVYIVWKDQSVNEYVKGIFTLVLGRFLGYLDNIYNFEFGTTRNSRTKDVTIEQLSKGGEK